VLQRRLTNDAPIGIVLEDLQQEVGSVPRSQRLDGHDIRDRMLPPLRELMVPVREAGQGGPGVRSRSPPALEDFEQLVDVGSTGEKRDARRHLSEDAADRPHVYRRRVAVGAQQKLRSAVPQGHHLVCVRSIGQA